MRWRLPLAIIAQSKTVTGVVNDEQGLPLPGVTVQVKGTNNLGAITNFDGEFTISIQSNPKQILIFSYVGFQTIEFDVTDTTSVNLSMEIDTAELDEVVVIGYSGDETCGGGVAETNERVGTKHRRGAEATQV